MREIKEIGSFTHYGEEVNQAYQVYASLYLDFVDDNPQKFFTRGIDDRPIEDCDEKDFTEAYMDTTVEIAQRAFSQYSPDDLYKEYPLLKKRSEELERMYKEYIQKTTE